MTLDFLSFRKPTAADAKLILDWRTAPHVAPFMLTKVEYDLEKQRAWLERCEHRNDYHHRLIAIHGRPVGLCSITITDPDTKTGEIGAYIGDPEAPRELTTYNFIPTLNHAFLTLGLDRLVNHIVESNPRTIRLQAFNGYRPTGVETGAVEKDGVKHDLHVFEQTREDWLNFRRKFKNTRDWDAIERPDPV